MPQWPIQNGFPLRELKTLVLKNSVVTEEPYSEQVANNVTGIPAPCSQWTESQTADQRLDHLLRQQSRERRKSMSSGVRPAQRRSQPRTPRMNEAVEIHELNSSGEDEAEAIEDFRMIA